MRDRESDIVTKSKCLTEKEMRDLLSLSEELCRKGIERHRNGLVRDSIILKMLLLTGVKLGELCNLKVNDCLVGFQKKFICIKRGERSRDIQIPIGLKNVLRWYIGWKKTIGETDDNGYLLCSQREKQYTRGAVYRRWKKYCPTHMACDARNSYGVALLKSSRNINLIQRQLGLAKKATVYRFVDPFREDLDGDLRNLELSLRDRPILNAKSNNADNNCADISFVKQIQSSAGYVYVIESNGLYKIGASANPDSRINALQTSCSFKVQCLCLILSNNMFELEKKLHRKYQSKRLNGEWFELLDKDIQEIVVDNKPHVAWSRVASKGIIPVDEVETSSPDTPDNIFA